MNRTRLHEPIGLRAKKKLEDLFRLVGLILSFNDKMFLFLQLLLFLDVQEFLKVHLLVHHL